jgi:type IVB pilus formation R64 PilN family outer membrane protein
MLFRLTLFSIISINLSGCTTLNQVNDISKNIKKLSDETQHTVQQNRVQSPPKRKAVRYLNKQWVSLKPIAINQKTSVRALRCKIKIATNEPVSILEFGQIVTKYCGLPVRITPDALSAIDNPLAADGATGGNSTAVPAPHMSGMPTSQSTLHNRLFDINYNGELNGLMDMVTARFGLSWKEEEGRIKLYNLDTETFYLNTLASDTEMHAQMQSGTTMVNGASGGATGSSDGNASVGKSGTNQNTTISLKTSIWKDIKNTIESMISVKGKIAISPSTGAITVTDNTETLARVREYITQENINLTKQVLFNIKVVSVTFNHGDRFGISWDAVFQALNNKYGFKLAGNFAAPDNAIVSTLSILKNSGSSWAGTDAVVNALSEQGQVSIVKEPSASTLNLQPVALQVARQEGFIAGTNTTNTAQVGSSTALQTGMITTGFNMSLLPYILQDNRMLLQFSINLSNLRRLRTVKSGTAIAELPELDLPINSTQKVRLSPGDTLMLTGFEQDDQNVSHTGSFTPKNFLFGGGMAANKTKSTLVVLITPVIME